MTFQYFTPVNAEECQFDLLVEMSIINLQLSFGRFGRPHFIDAIYQVSRFHVSWLWTRRFSKVFTLYGHGGHLGHVTQTRPGVEYFQKYSNTNTNTLQFHEYRLQIQFLWMYSNENTNTLQMYLNTFWILLNTCQTKWKYI